MVPDGRRLVFEVSGAHAATPVLFLPPIGGSTAQWGGFRAAVALRAPVIVFDPPPGSQSGDAPSFTSTRSMASEAIAVLDRLGVGRAHVFGISLGGMVATWLAIDAPRRVDRVCLASTPAAGVELAWRPLARAVWARARRPEVVVQVASAILHDARGQLHRIRAPVLVLAGDRDHVLGSRSQAALASAIPEARFEIIAGAGHDLTHEQPVSTAERTLRFLYDEARRTLSADRHSHRRE